MAQATYCIFLQYSKSSLAEAYINGLKAIDKTAYSSEELQKIYSQLEPKYKKSKDGITLLNYIKIGKPVKENDFYSDFTAFDNTSSRPMRKIIHLIFRSREPALRSIFFGQLPKKGCRCDQG